MPPPDDDDITTTRHHHNDTAIVGTPITCTRADHLAILNAVNTGQLNSTQGALLTALKNYDAA